MRLFLCVYELTELCVGSCLEMPFLSRQVQR